MKSTTELKLENLIRKLIKEESVHPKYIISYETDMGSGRYGGEFTNFEKAVKPAQLYYEKKKNAQNIQYVGVEPITHGDKFAIIFCTPEYFRDGGSAEFDNPNDRKIFRQALVKNMKTRQTQIGTYSIEAK